MFDHILQIIPRNEQNAFTKALLAAYAEVGVRNTLVEKEWEDDENSYRKSNQWLSGLE